MIVFLGNAGRLADNTTVGEAIFYFVAIIMIGAIFLVPALWTGLWLMLMFMSHFSLSLGWSEGLLIAYQVCFWALVACAVVAGIKEAIATRKMYKK